MKFSRSAILAIASKAFFGSPEKHDKHPPLTRRRLKSTLGLNLAQIKSLWIRLEKSCRRLDIEMPSGRLDHLLWALHLLKAYPTWDQMSVTFRRDEKTLRKWCKRYVQLLRDMDWVSTTPHWCVAVCCISVAILQMISLSNFQLD